jgi:hypothetical protein
VTSRSRLASGVYTYCDNPPDLPLKDGGLPQHLVFEVLWDMEAEMLRDLDLSEQSRRVGKRTVSPAESTFTLSFDGVPSYVSMRPDNSSEIWYPVEIVPHGSVTQAALDGRMAIGFFDNGTPQGEITWIPEGHEIAIWYDRSLEDQTLAGSTELGSLYDSHLKLKAAAQCRELMNLPVGPVMAARIGTSNKQWEKSVKMNRQQGTVTVPMVYTPRRYRRSDPRRFFVR